MESLNTSQTHWSLPDVMVEKYSDDLLMGVLDAINPRFSAIPYVRKKHQTHRFRTLLRLRELLDEKRDAIISRITEVLPKEASRMHYLKAQAEVIKIFEEELEDVMDEIDELMRILNEKELKNSIRTDIRRQIGLLNSMRDSILEIASDPDIPDEVFEKYMTLDQGIALLIKLYERMLEDWKNPELSIYILMLSLRILAILNGKLEHLPLLRKDIVEIAPELERTASPEEIEELIKLVGKEWPTSSTPTS
ncbi:hypothetical protein [Thermococcus sp. Bubb.Bath]|uniref:hypothetical protein n=1 Tax=Thermococcus sp. Bubb.Bath TaxID=1638242 RepID=UPI00143B43ED|nr:hypothetical protein [Thermococcus sp. Bubb.Bath]NJF25356.1 hypothetical protein [Thermococcus sp. Bubb.Bath]